MKKLLLATTILFASANVLATSETFTQLDTDKDGLISREEAKADDTLSAIFVELDLNQDGYLSEAEMDVKSDN